MPGSAGRSWWRGPCARGIFWGAAAGFTSTLIQAGAPPFSVFVLPQRLPKMTLVGTMTVFFAITNAMKVAPYFALGQFSTATLATSVLLLPLAVRDQLRRHLAGPGDAGRAVLPHRLLAGAGHLARPDLAGRRSACCVVECGGPCG